GVCGAGPTPVALILVLVLVAVGLNYGIQSLKRNKPESESIFERKECIMTQIRMTLIAGMEVAEAIATNSVAGALLT
uniref:hypothetical protein n=1 Tax=Streptomyces exfoliatus TaxID=1905 RepID=UPI001B8026D5